MDISTVFPALVSLIVVGALAGFLAGLLGMGGGIVLVPAFSVIIPMTFMFAPIGATVGHRMDAGPLKCLFGAFLLIDAANMVRSAPWP